MQTPKIATELLGGYQETNPGGCCTKVWGGGYNPSPPLRGCRKLPVRDALRTDKCLECSVEVRGSVRRIPCGVWHTAVLEDWTMERRTVNRSSADRQTSRRRLPYDDDDDRCNAISALIKYAINAAIFNKVYTTACARSSRRPLLRTALSEWISGARSPTVCEVSISRSFHSEQN